mgnify:CR=1 FL=1
MKIILNSQNFELSDTSFTFLEKYLERMENFIENNNIESEVYEDIEERIAEVFSVEKTKKISDKVVINIVNEIWEPDEIFSELIEEDKDSQQTANNQFKSYFSNNWEELTRNSKQWIFFGVCYGISQRYNLDPLFVRLFFICGTFLWGFTLLLYIALIFLLPNRLDKKKDALIIDKATQLKDSVVNHAKKAGKKLEKIEKKDLENFKDSIVNKAKDLWNKIDVQKIKDKLSSAKQSSNLNSEESESVSPVMQIEEKNNEKISDTIKTYPLNSNSNQIKEKIVYREVQPNFIMRFFRFVFSIIKNIILFIFHAGRYFLAFVILISAIPALITVLFTSGLIFSDFTVNNQILFNQVNLFLKIWIVGLLFSIFFGIFWIFLKLLAGKTVANIFMTNGLIGIFIFAFIWGLGFFKTANQFTNTYTNTQIVNLETKDLEIIENSNFTNDEWINWVNNLEFIPTENDKITVEITSIINRSSQEDADKIFSELIPVSSIQANQLDLSLLQKTNFSETVPYSFLRKNIKIFLPKDAIITFWNIYWDNIHRIKNLDYLNNSGEQKYLWWLHQCSNKVLTLESDSRYVCVHKIPEITGEESIILNEIDTIIEEEIKNVTE